MEKRAGSCGFTALVWNGGEPILGWIAADEWVTTEGQGVAVVDLHRAYRSDQANDEAQDSPPIGVGYEPGGDGGADKNEHWR